MKYQTWSKPHKLPLWKSSDNNNDAWTYFYSVFSFLIFIFCLLTELFHNSLRLNIYRPKGVKQNSHPDMNEMVIRHSSGKTVKIMIVPSAI